MTIALISSKPQPNGKFLYWSKLKALISADDKKKNEKFKFVFGMVGNILGKGVNAGYQDFLFSHDIVKNNHCKSL